MGILILGISVLSIMLVLVILQIWKLLLKVKANKQEKENQQFQNSTESLSNLIGHTIALKGSIRTTSIDVEKNTFTLEVEINEINVNVTLPMMYLQNLNFN